MKRITEIIVHQPIVKKHLSLVCIGFVLGILTYGYVHFNGFQNTTEALLSGLLGILLAYAVHFSNRLIDQLVAWKRQPGLRLLAGLVGHLLIASACIYLTLWLYGLAANVPVLQEENGEDVRTKIGILLFCMVLLYNIIYFAYYSYHHYSKGQLLEVRLKRKQTQLQLHALKSQLSPHFLFNSINTLSSLFQKDTHRAEAFIRSLASSYEYVLSKYESPLVLLGEELNFVEAYCFLVRTRFGDHLTVALQLSPELLQTKVPPLTLQMLVENAVKHNIVSADHPLKIAVSASDGHLIVTNNKTQKRPQIDSLKVGLSNIASRYELLTNKSIDIRNEDHFTVKLPIIV